MIRTQEVRPGARVMARDYAEIERQFIASLTEETGRDLEAWMTAIAGAGVAEKNDVIDWLRRQGVFFNTASKLERIFANGGRPLYGERAAGEQPEVARTEPAAPPAVSEPARPVPSAVQPAYRPPSPAPPAPPPANDDPLLDPAIEPLLAAARGYRPLANMILRAILRVVPDARLSAGPGHIVLARERAFAVLEPRPKDVRLALALGERAFDAVVTRTTVKGAPAHLGHMLTLSDARRVDADLEALVRQSAATA